MKINWKFDRKDFLYIFALLVSILFIFNTGKTLKDIKREYELERRNDELMIESLMGDAEELRAERMELIADRDSLDFVNDSLRLELKKLEIDVTLAREEVKKYDAAQQQEYFDANYEKSVVETADVVLDTLQAGEVIADLEEGKILKAQVATLKIREISLENTINNEREINENLSREVEIKNEIISHKDSIIETYIDENNKLRRIARKAKLGNKVLGVGSIAAIAALVLIL